MFLLVDPLQQHQTRLRRILQAAHKQIATQSVRFLGEALQQTAETARYIMQKSALLMKRNVFPLAFEINRGKKLLNASRASRVLGMNADSVGERELHLLIANQQSRQLRRGVRRDV